MTWCNPAGMKTGSPVSSLCRIVWQKSFHGLVNCCDFVQHFHRRENDCCSPWCNFFLFGQCFKCQSGTTVIGLKGFWWSLVPPHKKIQVGLNSWLWELWLAAAHESYRRIPFANWLFCSVSCCSSCLPSHMSVQRLFVDWCEASEAFLVSGTWIQTETRVSS